MKKKVLCLSIILAVLVAAMLGLGGKVLGYEVVTDGDWEYAIIGNNARILSYSGTAENLTIPSTINGYTVTELFRVINWNNSTTKNVVVPSTVKKMEMYTFNDGQVLASVKVLNPYCELGKDAIYVSGDPTTKAAFKIIADNNSTAHKYAVAQGYGFEKYDTHGIRTKTLVQAASTTDGYIKYNCADCEKEMSRTVIKKASNIKLSSTSYIYNGQVRTPSVTVKDSSGNKIASSNYTVKYPSGRKNAGTYKVTITLKGNYKGTVTKSYTIKKREMNKSNTKVADSVYTGKAKNPIVRWSTLTLKKGRDYTISKISKNKNIGTASVTLKMKGNYTGIVKKTFKIVPGQVKTISTKTRTTNSVTFKWSKVKGATGYKVYRYDPEKGMYGDYVYYKTTKSTSMKVSRKNNTTPYVDIRVRAYKKVGKTTYYGEITYFYDVVKPTKITKYTAKSPSKGALKVSFSSIPKEGYKAIQTQYSTNKSFKNAKDNKETYVNFKDYKYTSTTIKNLKSKKYYYVRVREYVYTSKGKLLSSPWSKTIKVYVK